jgi:hypothetical protein
MKTGVRESHNRSRKAAALDPAGEARREKAAAMKRLAEDRQARERRLERDRDDEAAPLVLLARAERAKRIAAGKFVAPTIDEYRERKYAAFPTMGDRA